MRILIIGGGIAGSALALALHDAGIESVVAEAQPNFDHLGGAFLTLAPNGINALQSLGLGDVPTAAGGFAQSGIDFFNHKGRRIAEMPGEDDETRYGARSMVMKRAGLHTVLADRARAAGVPFHFDARLTELRSNGSELRAVFANGETLSADMVIGADGIWSSVRRLTWPDAPLPDYAGIIDCGGWVETDLPNTDRQQMFFGAKAFFGYTVNDGLAYWFTNFPRGDEPKRGELDDLDVSQWMTTIRRLHADDPPVVRSILGAGSSALGAWPLFDMPKLEQWHTSRVCLVGDAAHAVSPSTGQGASLAIEDAAVLARCLRTAGSSQAAFAQFEHERKDRAERVRTFGRQIGNRKSPSAFGRIFRDRTLKFFLGMGSKAADEQYRYRVDEPASHPA